MKYLAFIVVCLWVVLFVGLACHQRTVGKEPQAPRSPSKESDSSVQEKEDLKLPLKEPRIVSIIRS